MRKIIPPCDIRGFSNELRIGGGYILVGGCFDVFHFGHEAFLRSCAKWAETLVVMLESDMSVRRKKGLGRPFYTQIERAEVLSEQEFVDHIILLPDLTRDYEYFELVKVLRPDIIGITKGDPYTEVISDYAESVGGKCVEVLKRIPGHSTTKIIEKYLT